MTGFLASIGGLFNRMVNVSHVIHVSTGDRRGAGTDANVWISFKDEEGNTCEEEKLNNWYFNDNERGKTSSFRIRGKHEVGAVTEIELWRDTWGVGDAWFVDRIEVEHVNLDGMRHVFPIQRWIRPDVRYSLRKFDSCLPQNSHKPQQRKLELEEKRTLYEYVVNVPGGPAQIKKLPDDEKFSGKYAFELVFLRQMTAVKGKIVGWGQMSQWKSFNEIKKVYKLTNTAVGRKDPYSLNEWETDKWFGLQRLQGCNPVLLKLCTEIPDKFGVTEEMVASSLEGLTLSEALDSKRLFIVDLHILEGLPCRAVATICAPLALFYLNKENDLMPIAIQLFQHKGPENPVFTPKDPYFTWLLVKMYYNNADATYHQSYTHLGFTHLIMEGVVICTHRQLSSSHPLFRLLAPHFLYLLAINTRGIDKLVSKDGWVDTTMSCGRDGMFELIKRGMQVWRLDLNGNIPAEIKSRGVLEAETLPYYPYRDDAVAIYMAIRDYVGEIVRHYYRSKEDIENDFELQNWRKELSLSRDKGGVGIVGVPGGETGFQTVDEIIDTITAIISVCSIGHAAANFQQYDEYAFPPNYPASLYGEVPKDKRERTEVEVISYVPRKDTTLAIMVITNVLSNKATKVLGDFEVKYMYDPVATDATATLKTKLVGISEAIKQRHTNDNTFSYYWLDPQNVPNSIGI